MEKKTKIIGRVDECSRLKECMDADSAQLIIVYGRRRVGKACPIGQVLLVILLGRYCQGGFYMIDERSIARRIREERRKAGISQDCLGKKLGVDGFYISKLENNKKGLSLNMIAEISKALHVSADYLIFGNDLRKDGLEDKLATVLHGCSDNERKVLYEAICALKRILINNRYDK